MKRNKDIIISDPLNAYTKQKMYKRKEKDMGKVIHMKIKQ